MTRPIDMLHEEPWCESCGHSPEWCECQEPAICGACRGSGMGLTPKQKCRACKGSGEAQQEEADFRYRERTER
jgi:DnaJ-class molecular chaperone